MLRGHSPAAEVLARHNIAAVLLRVVTTHPDDMAVAAEACWVLSFMTANSSPVIGDCLRVGWVPLLLALLERALASEDQAASEYALPALRTIGNICAGAEGGATVVLADARTLPSLQRLLLSTNRALKLEALWVVSTVAGGSSAEAGALVAANIVPLLVAQLSGPHEARVEAAHGLLNIADHAGGAEALLTANATDGFAALLRTPLVPLVLLGLQYVELVLRTGGQPAREAVMSSDMCEMLEALQYHDNENIRLRASMLIERYFPDDEAAAAAEAAPQSPEEYPAWRTSHP